MSRSMTEGTPRSFQDLFGRAPEYEATAPGRVNLIGEHTDYHDGFVLPTGIPQQTRVQVARRADGRVRLWSANVPDDLLEFDIGRERLRRSWIDYVQGLSLALAQHDVSVPGFDLRVESDVPAGAGLSSSAALEISVLRGLRG